MLFKEFSHNDFTNNALCYIFQADRVKGLRRNPSFCPNWDAIWDSADKKSASVSGGAFYFYVSILVGNHNDPCVADYADADAAAGRSDVAERAENRVRRRKRAGFGRGREGYAVSGETRFRRGTVKVRCISATGGNDFRIFASGKSDLTVPCEGRKFLRGAD